MLIKRYSSAQDLDGVIDLERLRSGPADSLERDSDKFFELTFPTEEVHLVLRGLSQRFGKDEGPGTILAQSVKGLGKSHTLLLGYHLFKSPGEARNWMKKLGYEWAPPDHAEVIVHKFTDQAVPEDALWLLISNRLGLNWSDKRPPELDEFRVGIGDRHLVLILDELERGINNILDPARRSQNLSFLQMVSEEANRDRRVTLFAAIYDGNAEPGSTLKRTPKIELRFRKPEDRAAIVRHRLFSNADFYDRDSARSLIRSYANTWQRFGLTTPDAYVTRTEAAFPFLPDLIDLVFERITQTGGFQGTRSALGLLGAMLDAGGEGVYLMTAAHCKLTDRACADRLQDLDPAGQVINCAQGNYRDLAGQPYAQAIASATLLASLVPGGRTVGLSRDELVRHVVTPGSDPNEFHFALEAFKKFGTYFHERDGRLLFDLEENEYAKVELDALKFSDEVAKEQIIQIWRQEVFKDTQQTIVFQDADTAKNDLLGLSSQAPRFVFAPRRLSAPERHSLYMGTAMRNQILLLEPRDSRVNHLANPDLSAFAKRLRAAQHLANSASSAERRKRFEDIKTDEGKQIQRILKSAGLVYVRVDGWADIPETTHFEEEGLGQASSKQEVLEQLRTQVYPPSLFQEHLRARLKDFIGQRVEQVDRTYRNTLGFPVPLTVGTVTDSLRALAEDRTRVLGLQHTRGSFCGELVKLSEPELNQAVLTPPWPVTAELPLMPPSMPGAQTLGSSLDTSSGMPGIGGRPQPAAPAPAVMTDERATSHCRTLGELRQQVAARLTDLDAPTIRTARFSVFADYKGRDLTGLPAAYRGALAGVGDLDLQLDIILRGPMTKAQLEQHCEKLPNLTDANYAARITVELLCKGEADQSDEQ